MTTRHTVRLDGCGATPLANYLKALGIFRLLAEQVDPETTAWWEGDALTLESALDEAGIADFFAKSYHPSPIVAPWNRGSGFYPKDARDARDMIANSTAPRLELYRRAIEAADEAVFSSFPPDSSSKFQKIGSKIRQLAAQRDNASAQERTLLTKQIKGLQGEQDGLLSDHALDKPALLQHIRNVFPDEMLTWFDAAVVLGGGDPKYPPLLGTGGNDGRLDFTNNFMQRVCELFEPEDGQAGPECIPALRNCLYGDIIDGLPSGQAIGQFLPSAAGGANMNSSFGAAPLNNSWDFVFMIEGALLFASALTRRQSTGSREALSYPFAFYPSSAGYGSAAFADETTSRAEQWVPLWHKPARYVEISSLFAEGRAQVGRKVVSRGVDFARAISTLGTDRGIDSFQRYSFQERNGLAFLAVDLGRWSVAQKTQFQLLAEVDRWVDAFRRTAKGPNAPTAFGRQLRSIENAVMDSARRDGSLSGVLCALGAAEEIITRSPRTAAEAFLRPLPLLSLRWIDAANDGSPEFRLACSLASIQSAGHGDDGIGPLRSNMLPYEPQKPYAPFDSISMDKPHVVWQGGSLVSNLIAVLRRRCMDAQHSGLPELPLAGRYPAQLADVAAFVEGNVNEYKIEAFLRGLNAVDWRGWTAERTPGNGGDGYTVQVAYRLLKLTHATQLPDGSPVSKSNPALPFDPGILAAAASGRCAEATRRASHRLRASGWMPIVSTIGGSGDHIRRCAAAVLFPLSATDLRSLSRVVLRKSAEEFRTMANADQ